MNVTNLRLKNPPNVFISVKGDSETVHFSDLQLDATSKSANPAKNTDGFDIGASSNVVISNVSVTNDDDCVAFKPGANGVIVTDITCTGSHGEECECVSRDDGELHQGGGNKDVPVRRESWTVERVECDVEWGCG